MLRDVVIHILNEQPILADLLSEPQPSDVALICRNLRTINGKKPVFIDKADSTFVLPLAGVRFIEIHQESMAAHEAEKADEAARALAVAAEAEAESTSLALARLDWDGGNGRAGPDAPGEVESDDLESDAGFDELDDDLLRRIREV